VDWLQVAVTILGGALAGGLTNRVAIWMLFHPHRPPEVAGRRLTWLQGAVPKNQDRLAESIGGAVGTRLLGGDDLARALRSAGLREAFRRRLRTGLRRLVREDLPPPAEWLPADALEEARSLVVHLVIEGRPLLADVVSSPAFAEGAGRALEGLARTLDREDEAGPLSPGRIGRLRDRTEGWLADAVASEAFEARVEHHVDRIGRDLLRPGRSLGEVIPRGLTNALEDAVASYLPLLMGRLGRLLEDPGARERFQAAVGDVLQRFMDDLRFHQRVVARLVITEETVERVVVALEEEGAERLGELLREEDVQRAVARRVEEAVDELLARPATEVLGHPDDPSVRQAVDRTAAWVVRTARTPSAREALLDAVEDAAREAGGGGWEGLLRRIPVDTWSDAVAALLRSDAGRAVAGEAARALADRVLHRPLRVPEGLVGRESADRLARALEPPLWRWIEDEVPALAARVPVADKVEEKVREFPLSDLEELVRAVTQRELDLIVRLGYGLGAFIGGLLVAFDLLTG
jgi:hypothetical protein